MISNPEEAPMTTTDQAPAGPPRVLCTHPCTDPAGHHWIANGVEFEGRRMYRCVRGCDLTTFDA